MVRVIRQFCEDFDLLVHWTNETTFMAHFSRPNGKWHVGCHVENTCLAFHSILPVTVPNEKRGAVMEYITRANYGLSVGNFELDLDDGEVRFKTSVELADGELTPAMIGTLLACNLTVTDFYLRDLYQVLFADVEPAAAVRALEAAQAASVSLDEEALDELLDDVDLGELKEPGND
jgi:hypothetical protein